MAIINFFECILHINTCDIFFQFGVIKSLKPNICFVKQRNYYGSNLIKSSK